MTSIALPFTGVLPLVLFLAKATLLLCAAFAGTMWLRNGTAGSRHLIWLAALVGVLALPLLARIPVLHFGVLPEVLSPANDIAAAPASAVIVTPDVSGNTVIVSAAPAPPSGVAGQAVPAAAPVIVAADEVDIVSPPAGVAAFVAPFSRSFSGRVVEMLAAVWAIVALVLVGWLIAGMCFVRRIVSRARELTSPDWTTPLCEVADRLDLEVPPRLVISDRIEMAFACRATAPTIVLPAAAESWSDDRRRAVLFHELAHVKRHDLVGHMLGRLACALYWFHPLVWSAAKQLRAESERACDDLVLSCGARASEYAQHLLDMVTAVRDHGAPVMALPMARKKEFEGRMLAILDPAIRRASPNRAQAAAVIATIGAVSLTVAAVAPAAAHPTPAGRTVVRAAAPAPTSGVSAPAPIVAAPETIAAPKPVTPAPDAPAVMPSTHTQIQTSTSTVASTSVNTTFSNFVSEVATAAANGTVKGFIGLLKQGNRPGPDSTRIQALIRILETDTDASVRRTAAWGLNDMQSPNARAALIKAVHQDTDASVREMAAWALADYDGNADVASTFVDALKDKNVKVRATAAWGLGTIDAQSSANALESVMNDPEGEVREVAIWSYAQLDQHTAPPAIVSALNDAQPRVRRVAAWALGEIADKSTAKTIANAFGKEQDKDVRIAEIHALAEMGETSPDVLEAALKSTDPDVRRRAVGMLAGNGGSWPWPWPWPRPRPSP